MPEKRKRIHARSKTQMVEITHVLNNELDGQQVWILDCDEWTPLGPPIVGENVALIVEENLLWRPEGIRFAPPGEDLGGMRHFADMTCVVSFTAVARDVASYEALLAALWGP